jgi:L,D-transpeptidase ErfK/SrfK
VAAEAGRHRKSVRRLELAMAITSLSALGRGLLLAVLFGINAPGNLHPASGALAGGPVTYAARSGDSLTSVAARFGIDVPTLAELNGLKPTARLKLGQELRIDNPHLVPLTLDDGIVINIPQRMLFYFKSGSLVAAYPAGLGRRSWRTPLGDFEVLEKEKDKTWVVPVSIQKEMLRKGLPLRTKVPPGPKNPLGRYWIRISSSEGIHGTNAPASIYKFQTHGCIRLLPENIASLFEEVPIGTPVKIVYEPVLLARLPGGDYYLEVHPDVYRKAGDPLETVKRTAEAAGAESMIDWQEVRKAIRERRGLAENVSLPAIQNP